MVDLQSHIWHRTFATRGLPLLIVFIAFACVQDDPSKRLYDEFREYRIAVSEDQRRCFDFFSRRVLSDWLDSLLYVEDASLVRQIDNTWQLFLVGASVEKVYQYNIEKIDARRQLLTIYYSNRTKEGLRQLGVTYIETEEGYLIDGFDLYVGSFGEMPTSVIDDFSELYTPTVDEILERSQNAWEKE